MPRSALSPLRPPGRRRRRRRPPVWRRRLLLTSLTWLLMTSVAWAGFGFGDIVYDPAVHTETITIAGATLASLEEAIDTARNTWEQLQEMIRVAGMIERDIKALPGF